MQEECGDISSQSEATHSRPCKLLEQLSFAKLNVKDLAETLRGGIRSPAATQGSGACGSGKYYNTRTYYKNSIL